MISFCRYAGHCVVSLREALRRAKELQCDLVEVTLNMSHSRSCV